MNKSQRQKFLFWCGLVAVFLLALLPRLFYPASRYLVWYDRSIRFWDALLEGDLSGTFQRSHPGVTTMWIAGFGLRVSMAIHGWSSDDLFNLPPMLSGPQGPPAQAGVAALSVVIAVCIVLIYILLVRLKNWPLAFVAGCLLALDPFHITHSKMIHVDALLTIFMLLSALSWIGYLPERRKGYLISSGVFAGLAFLTKSPSLFLIPYVALVTTLHHLMAWRRAPVSFPRVRIWSRRLWEIARILVAWSLVAACVFFLLWPAMWVRPWKMVSKIEQHVQHHAQTAHPGAIFFAGQVTQNPGPLYYVATLAWKTTLVTLPAIGAAILFLIRQRPAEEERRLSWYMLIYAGGFVLLMTLGAKKWMRYSLPAFGGLDVLAAWGLVQLASAVGRRSRLRERAWIPAAIVATALVIQAITVFRHHPYYGTHHNLLLGGSRVAQHVLHLGDQGEGLDLAAHFLNSRPGAERIVAGVQDKDNLMFRDNFVGRIAHPVSRPGADYRVFFVHYNQRWGGVSSWEACQQEEPIWSVSFDGVPYAWICRTYPHDPEALAIDHRLDVQLGDHIRLLGYRLSADSLSAGDALTATLFWQLDGPLVEDYHVFVHLLGANDLMGAQHDGVPVRGKRPTWSWQDGEVFRDEHTLVTDVSLPDGAYALSTGMYDYATQARLPAIGPDGERLPEDRVVLQDIQVKE